ncbi:MAG: hypothetical protein AAGJ46_01785 [Planctomycetota bacterium]
MQELSRLLGEGRVKSLTELGRRSYEVPEAKPCIERITVHVAANS